MTKVSKREIEMFDQLRRERDGTAGMIQCAGCPDPNLVPEAQGLCAQHMPKHPDAWQAYQPGYDESYDVIGNL